MAHVDTAFVQQVRDVSPLRRNMDNSITARRMTSGDVLKLRKGLRFVIPYSFPTNLSSSSEFNLTEPAKLFDLPAPSSHLPLKTRGFTSSCSPGIGQPIAFRPWIQRVQHVLVHSGDPTTARDFREDGCARANLGFAEDPARERRADKRARGQPVAGLHYAAGVQHSN